MATAMTEEERVTSLLSISTKAENQLESKKRWGDVFLPSTRGKECLLVIARGGADLFKYLIEEVSFFCKGTCRDLLHFRFGRTRNVGILSTICF